MNLWKINFKYLPIFLVALALTPILWFWGKGDILINGVDTNFPLNPEIWFLRRFFVWYSNANAGSDFSSSTAGLFFHFIQYIPFKLGLSLPTVQLTSLIFWFALILASAYFFAYTHFKKNYINQALFVSLYGFNTYLFNTWENVKVANLSLVSALPLGLGLFTLLDKKKVSYSTGLFASSIIGIILSGAGINPAYISAFFVTLFLFAVSSYISDRTRIKSILINVVIVSLPIILINLFWILPTMNYILRSVGPSGSISHIGFTDWVDSLSANTSLFNILRLQGAWDWYSFDQKSGLPLYIPYALNYLYSPIFILFSTLLPATAFLSLIFRNKKQGHLYLSFASFIIVGVFLGAGTHEPTGSVFKWLSINLPFFSLFRSPWYIFTPMVVIAYAGLIVLLYEKAGKYFETTKSPYLNWLPLFALVVFILGNLVYTYPLITGKIFRPGRNDTFFVQVPQYVFEAEEWLRGKEGRILSYPDDEIERFNWGYTGVDSILGLFANNEIYYSPLNAPASPVAKLLKQVYLNFKRGEIDSAQTITYKLGIDKIFYKSDQPSLSPDLPFEVTQTKLAEFGAWKFYEFPGERLSKVSIAKSLISSEKIDSGEDVIGLINRDYVLVNKNDSALQDVPEITQNVIITTNNSQKDDYLSYVKSFKSAKNYRSRELNSILFTFSIKEDGMYQPILEKYSLEDFGLNPEDNIPILINGQQNVLEYDTSTPTYIYYKHIELVKGDYQIRLNFLNPNLINANLSTFDGFSKVGDGEFSSIFQDNVSGASLVNISEKNISLKAQVADFNPFIPILVQAQYKQIRGRDAAISLTQYKNSTVFKSDVKEFPTYQEWSLVSFYYEPVQSNSELTIDLLSQTSGDPLGTKVQYANLAAHKVFMNDLFLQKVNTGLVMDVPSIAMEFDNPVEYKGKVTSSKGSHMIVFADNYSQDWSLEISDIYGDPIDVETKHFTANLYSNAWYVKNPPSEYKFRVFYKPQNLFKLGMLISLVSLVSFAGLLLFNKYMNYAKK